jgi:hypothetical protein
MSTVCKCVNTCKYVNLFLFHREGKQLGGMEHEHTSVERLPRGFPHWFYLKVPLAMGEFQALHVIPDHVQWCRVVSMVVSLIS